MTIQFNQLNLHPQLVQAVTEMGYSAPTPIQEAVIPQLLAGSDVIGQAQTGTGKTAAFGLPLLNALAAGLKNTQSLVLTPTRELAIQVAQALFDYGRHRGVRVLAVYGGQPYARQIIRLKKGVDVVVGTPGRLLDLIRQKALYLGDVKSVVLDEADEMLGMGFIADIEAILEQTPAQRQTALFSATLPNEIRTLAERYMHQPRSVTIHRKQRTAATVEQRYYLVNAADKLAALTRLFEVENIGRALIFARTRTTTGELANQLSLQGFPAEALNGDLCQEVREQVLGRFRRNPGSVLVATDVAARGLDIDDISHVVNFDLPQDPEAYLHRVGRTARAGKTGIAISLLTPQEKWRLRRIEGFTQQPLSPAVLPTVTDIETKRRTELLDKMAVWLRRGRCQQEKEMVAELAAAGHDPVEIAAVALKLVRASEKQRPVTPISAVQTAAPRAARPAASPARRPAKTAAAALRPTENKACERGMVRLSLGAGKTLGIRPSDVVGTIAYHAEIPGRTIGAIRIENDHTLVDVPSQFVAQVLAKTGRYRIRRQPVAVALA
ncbi:MAG: DEAD/DEAH box helicase [Desulfobacterales bacterium]